MSDDPWSRCAPWIESALEFGGDLYTLDDVRAEVLKGEAILWPGTNSAVVTQFWDFPREKACNFWLAGGDLDELMNEMRPAIEAWAVAQGCARMIIAGRAGWAKVLKQHDYAPVWTALSKDLTA